MIWVRSQEKYLLVKCDEVYIEKLDDYYHVLIDRDKNRSTSLARYSSLEKALKVLDQIEFYIIKYNDGLPYQMPLDSEVE